MDSCDETAADLLHDHVMRGQIVTDLGRLKVAISSALSEARDQGAREALAASTSTFAVADKWAQRMGSRFVPDEPAPSQVPTPLPALAPLREAGINPRTGRPCGHEYIRIPPGNTGRVCMLCGATLSSAQGSTTEGRTDE